MIKNKKTTIVLITFKFILDVTRTVFLCVECYWSCTSKKTST